VLYSILPQIVISVGRTFLYNPLMLFYAILLGLSGDKENKKSLGSSLQTTSEIMTPPRKLCKGQCPTKKKKKKKKERDDGGQRN
jgi:hypothetical protein